jgi:CheY-like chemotaxis protein
MTSTDTTRVLIVDDEPQIARSMKRILRECDVTLVSTGEAALAAACAGDYDVIFCDLMMPGMSGMDVHSALAAQRPGAEAKIVFMSGGAYTERGQSFLETVDNQRLAKPFDISEVRSIVARCHEVADDGDEG